jgi:hypothetical protein
MQRVNMLSGQIRSTPAARNVISNPVTYTTELNQVYEKLPKSGMLQGLLNWKLLRVNRPELLSIIFMQPTGLLQDTRMQGKEWILQKKWQP